MYVGRIHTINSIHRHRPAVELRLVASDPAPTLRATVPDMGKQLYKPWEKIGKTHGKHRAKPRYLRGETWVVDFPPTQCINLAVSNRNRCIWLKLMAHFCQAKYKNPTSRYSSSDLDDNSGGSPQGSYNKWLITCPNLGNGGVNPATTGLNSDPIHGVKQLDGSGCYVRWFSWYISSYLH